jgi:hypothetical protein
LASNLLGRKASNLDSTKRHKGGAYEDFTSNNRYWDPTRRISRWKRFADSIDILVGDKDGFGFTPACPDTGTCPALSAPIIDNRSAAEMAATNGAQVTDSYSAINPGFSPPGQVGTVDVRFPFIGTLLSATLTFAGGDFQSNDFGALPANINGTAVSFSFADGRFVTALHSFTLNAAQIAAANAAGQVVLHLDRGSSGDFIAFDWFEVTGETATTTVPEPGSLFLLASVLGAFAMIRGGKALRRF